MCRRWANALSGEDMENVSRWAVALMVELSVYAFHSPTLDAYE
jgi:hypothetical protein